MSDSVQDEQTGPNPVYHQKNGSFRHGNPGRPKGIKNRPKGKRITPSDRRALSATAHEKVMATVTPELEALVRKILDKALDGDMSAAGLLMRHAVPPASQTVVRDSGDLVGIPPEDRVREIGNRVASGALSVEAGSALIKLAESEIQAALIEPLKRILRDFKKTRDVFQFSEQLLELPIGTVIDQEAEEEEEGE